MTYFLVGSLIAILGLIVAVYYEGRSSQKAIDDFVNQRKALNAAVTAGEKRKLLLEMREELHEDLSEIDRAWLAANPNRRLQPPEDPHR